MLPFRSFYYLVIHFLEFMDDIREKYTRVKIGITEKLGQSYHIRMAYGGSCIRLNQPFVIPPFTGFYAHHAVILAFIGTNDISNRLPKNIWVFFVDMAGITLVIHFG